MRTQRAIAFGALLALSAFAAACGGSESGSDGAGASPGAAEISPTRTATASPTPSATAEPSQSPTAQPTAGATPTAEATLGPEVASILSVTDGDTIRVVLERAEFPVRLILVDTPEPSTSACYADEATAYLRSLLPVGASVTMEKDVSEIDRFRRLLRYVYLESGEMVNELLVRNGFAKVAVFPPDVKYLDRLRAAEAIARTEGLGLWGACAELPAPTQTPATSPPAGSSCGGASAEIVALDKRGSPEVVVIEGTGTLTGWYLVSTRGEQRFDFPADFTLDGVVRVLSGDGAAAAADALLWTTSNMWNNSSNDDAELYDCEGALVDTFDDGR